MAAVPGNMAAFLCKRFRHIAKHRDLFHLPSSSCDIRDRHLDLVGNESDAH